MQDAVAEPREGAVTAGIGPSTSEVAGAIDFDGAPSNGSEESAMERRRAAPADGTRPRALTGLVQAPKTSGHALSLTNGLWARFHRNACSNPQDEGDTRVI